MICCGLLYNTKDPDTYWCINTYLMKKPTIQYYRKKKIEKEVVYSLCCKKNGCIKIEIHRYIKEKDTLKLLFKFSLTGKAALHFLENTKNDRKKLPQIQPLKNIHWGNKIPWVYGKAIDGNKQVPRYIDESGNRNVLKNNIWKSEIYISEIHTIHSTL